MKKRVLLVDDQIAIREMLAQELRLAGDYEVVGQVRTGLEGLKVCQRLGAEVIILDLLLPELSGMEMMRRLRRDQPQLRVLVFSGTWERSQMLNALRQHPHGYVAKSEPLCVLKEAIRVVAHGGAYFSAHVSGLQMIAAGPEDLELTDREREILQLVATSFSSKEIAARLSIAPKTVENHRGRIMEKLALHDVAGLTRWAMKHGLVA